MNPQQQSPITQSPISNYQDLQNLSASQQPQQQAQPQAPHENFLERLLPTIGGVGGGILGSLVSPFIGTAAGSGIGEGLGKAAENLFTGQSVGNGVGSDVASGAASGLLGAGLGKVAEGAGGLLSNIGEKAATNAAESEAASQAAQQVSRDSEMQTARQAAETADKQANDLAAQLDALKTANKSKLDALNTANQTKQASTQASAEANQAAQAPINRQAAVSANYGSILPKVQKLWNLGPNQDFVDSMGFDSVNPYDMQKVAQAGGDLNDVIDEALKNVPTPIDLRSEISGMLKSAMDGPYKVDVAQSSLGRALSSAGVDVTNTQVPAPVVRNLMQNVGEEMGNSQRIIEAAKDTGQNPLQEESNLKDLSNLYNTLRGKLSSNAFVNQSIKDAVVTPEMRDQFVQKYGPQLGDYLSTKITEAKNYDEIVPEMQKFAQMNRSSKTAIDDIEKARSGTLANKRISLGANPGEPAPGVQPTSPLADSSADFASQAEALKNQHAAQELEMQGKVEQAQLKAKQLHDKADMMQQVQEANASLPVDQSDSGVLGHIVNAAGHTVGGNKAGALTSLLRAGGAAGPGVATKAGSLLNRLAPFVPSATIAAGTVGGLGAGGNNDMQNVSDNMQQQQANPLDELIQANMAQNILAPGPYGSTSGSFLSALAPQMQKAQLAQSVVNNMIGAFGGAGGAQGMGGGMLSRLSGMIPGTSANAFQQRSDATAAQLAQLLGISPQAAQGLLPQLMQNPQTGGQTIGGLQSTLGALTL